MANTQLPTHMARLNWQSDVDVHVCGPPPMVDTVALWLQQLGQPADRVHYERWW
jgi:ferredoxin-NADP reductase